MIEKKLNNEHLKSLFAKNERGKGFHRKIFDGDC